MRLSHKKIKNILYTELPESVSKFMLAHMEDLYQLFENGSILLNLHPVHSMCAPRLDFFTFRHFKARPSDLRPEMKYGANDLNFLGYQNLYQHLL